MKISVIRKFETLDDLDKWLLESNKELEKFKNYMKVLADNNINFEGLIEVKDFVGTNLNNLKEQNSLSKINIEDLINKSAIATNKIIELDKRNENLDAIKEINSIAEKNIKNLESSNDLYKNILDLDDRNKKSIENIETLNKKNNDAITTINNLNGTNDIANKNITDLEAKNKIANETKDSLIKENDEAKKMIDSVGSNILGFKSLEKEVMDSRKDFNNTIHENLEDRLQEDLSVLFNKINNASLLDYQDTNITARDSFEGYTKDLSIKGQTLQNLCLENLTLTRNKNDTGIVYKAIKVMAKPNTKYTVVFNVEKNTTTKKADTWGIYLDGATEGDNNIIPNSTPTGVSKVAETGLFKLVFTSRKNLNNIPKLIFGFHCDYDKNYECEINNILLLEGDYSNKDVPQFFEGIKSVAENQKIQIKTIGKNLFDKTKLKKGSFNWNTGIINDDIAMDDRCVMDCYIKIKPNTTYILSKKSSNWQSTIILDKNFNQVGKIDSPTNSYVINTANGNYLRIMIQSDIQKALNDDIQLEEGDKITAYEPYKEETKTVILDEPLRSIEDPKTNMIFQDKITSDGKLIRRIKKEIITDKTNGVYSLVTNEWDDIYAFFLVNVTIAFNEPEYPKLAFPNGFGKCISDKFTYDNFILWIKKGRKEGITCINAQPNYIGICIKKERLKTPDCNGFIDWLKTNPITIYYAVENPIITDLKDVVNLNLRTYEGTTHINSNNTIPATIECKVPSNMPKIVKNLKSKNIELNNQLTALSKEQIKKATYELENDFRLADIEMKLNNKF